MNNNIQKPTSAFVGASWGALLTGLGAYLFGLWNSDMQLNEKGYYFAVILFGLFAAVSLQKSVRDRLEGINVTGIYYAICWFSLAASITLLGVGLWNATLELSEKGFYGMAYILSVYAAVAVQKNVRDLAVDAAENTVDHYDDAEPVGSQPESVS
ncbi:inner membrane protein YiaA [Endozoicomonadaceae bacterium StTr2]